MDMKPPDDKVSELIYKNQRLGERVQLQRQEIRQLEANIESFEKQNEEYQETLLCINRLWNQLNNDVVFLISRATGQEVSSSHNESHNCIGNGSESQDPFLGRLLKGDGILEGLSSKVKSLQRDLDDGFSDVEVGLRARMQATNDALSYLIDVIDRERARHELLGKQLAEGCSDDQYKQELETLREECATIRRQLDNQQALTRLADAHIKSLTDELHKEKHKLRQVNNELADKIEELAVAQRKLLAAKNEPDSPQQGAREAQAAPSGTAVATVPNVKIEHQETGSASDTLIVAELDEVKKLLAKRTSELDSERENLAKLEREVKDARAALQNENYVLQSRLYQLAQKQMNNMQADIEKLTAAVDTLQRDLDKALHVQQELKIKAESGEVAKRAASTVDARISDLEQKLSAAVAARDDMEVQLHRERERLGSGRTLDELTVMVNTLQKQNSVFKSTATRQQIAVEHIETTQRETAQARAAVEAKELELKELRQQLEKKEQELVDAQGQHTQLKEHADELRVFVEVLLNFCDDPRDVVEVRLSESKLREEVSQLKQQLANHAPQKLAEESKAEGKEIRRRAKELKEENRSLKGEVVGLKKEVEVMKERIRSLTEDCDAYISEIETIGSAYEDMQTQNARLLKQVTERDEDNNRLAAEQIRAVQQKNHQCEDIASTSARIQSAEMLAETHRARAVELEGQVQAAINEVAATRDQARACSTRAESIARELRECNDALMKSNILMEEYRQQANDRKRALEEESERLQKEKSKRQRVEDELKVVQSKFQKLRGAAERREEETVSELQEEVSGLRTLLRCSVCSQRQKNTIITKCYHMFCSKCIQRNLEVRHRKCPGCNIPFGKEDVKPIYFS